jgi:hypothetical protein
MKQLPKMSAKAQKAGDLRTVKLDTQVFLTN